MIGAVDQVDGDQPAVVELALVDDEVGERIGVGIDDQLIDLAERLPVTDCVPGRPDRLPVDSPWLDSEFTSRRRPVIPRADRARRSLDRDNAVTQAEAGLTPAR